MLATIIGYDSGYLNGVLGSADFARRYGVSTDGNKTYYLTPRVRSLFSSILVVGTLGGCCLATALPDRGIPLLLVQLECVLKPI